MRREKYKGFQELKKLAAEKFLKVASNKLFIDIRKVRRFRIWQGEYLNHVMHGIGLKDSEKQHNLKRKYLQFLNFIISKRLQRSLLQWSSKAKLFKIYELPNNKLNSTIHIIGILLRWDTSNMNKRDFPLQYIKSNLWKATRMKTALFKWKRKTVSALLGESHREMGVIKIIHFLHKKVTPRIGFAVRKICLRHGQKIGCNVMMVAIKSVMFGHKHYAFMNLAKKQTNFTPRSKFIREKRAKNTLLQKFAAIKKLTIISNKKFNVELRELKVFLAFIAWKKIKKRQSTSKSHNRMKGPSRRIKQLAIKFMISKSKSLIKHFLNIFLMRWKFKIVKSPDFPIDKNIYCNQAQISAYIESQIILKSLLIKKSKKHIKISNLNFIIIKCLRQVFHSWVSLIQREQNKSQQEDAIFEYIHYLEDNLGVPHKFRN